jgi:hypothetical protein
MTLVCPLPRLLLVDLPDQKHFSSEQIDFLDKFFKDNPWADSAPVESVAKATCLTDSIIKVGPFVGDACPHTRSRQAYVDQRRAKWNSMYAASNGYFNYNHNEFIPPSNPTQAFIKNDFDITTARKGPSTLMPIIGSFRLASNEFFCSSSTPAGNFPIATHAAGMTMNAVRLAHDSSLPV